MISSLFSVPNITILLLLASIVLLKKHRKIAFSSMFLALSSLIILSLPITALNLLKSVESEPALLLAAYKKLPNQPEVDQTAIVVLAHNRQLQAAEYGRIDKIDQPTLQRLLYVNWLQKHNPLPILLSGGNDPFNTTPRSVLMNQTLVADFSIAPSWIESKSQSLSQSAEYSSQILQQADIGQIVLVSHSFNMQRAKLAFENQGITVIAAPINFSESMNSLLGLPEFLPDSYALHLSNIAIQEKLLQLSYKMSF